VSRFSPTAPLFPGADAEWITRGTLQYRILRAFKKAGNNSERPSGALVYGLRYTFATELANANVSVYTLMKLLGHESMVTWSVLTERDSWLLALLYLGTFGFRARVAADVVYPGGYRLDLIRSIRAGVYERWR